MHADMSFIRHSNEMEYDCRISNWLQVGSHSGLLDLPRYHLHKPFDSYYAVRDIEENERE